MSFYSDPDAWRRTYDDWKLLSPDDEYYGSGYYDEDEPECPHDEFDIDIFTGRAECSQCNETWMATEAQMAAQMELEEDWAKEAERQARPWNRLWRRWRNSRACRWLVLTSVYQRYSRWIYNRKLPPAMDDDIPF